MANQVQNSSVRWTSQLILNNKDELKSIGLSLSEKNNKRGVFSWRKSSDLNLGALIQPFGTTSALDQRLPKSPPRCSKCRSYICNRSTIEITTGQWKCVFCDADNKTTDYSVIEDRSAHVELTDPVYEFEEMNEANIDNNSINTRPLVVIIDSNIDAEGLKDIKQSLSELIMSRSAHALTAVMSVGRTVGAFILSRDFEHVTLLRVSSTPNTRSLVAFTERRNEFLVTAEQLPKIESALDSMINSSGKKQKDPPRALGAALEVALALLKPASVREASRAAEQLDEEGSMESQAINHVGGHVLVLLSGPPNTGLGAVPKGASFNRNKTEEDVQLEQAVEFFKMTAERAWQLNATVNVCSAGMENCELKVLRHLTTPTGGVVLSLPDWSATLSRDLAALDQCNGYDALLSIRTDERVPLMHMIGPARQVSGNARPSLTRHVDKNDTATICQVTSVNQWSTLALYFDLDEDLADDEIFFQFTVQYTDTQLRRVTRVITESLKTTGSMSTYLASFNLDNWLVLLAKKCVLAAEQSESAVDAVHQVLDERLKTVVQSVGELKENNYVLPASLETLPFKIFMLRRSPVLGQILQHPDDIEYLRGLFLSMTPDACQRVIEPLLLLASPDNNFTPTPTVAENLVLQSNHVILFDQQTDVYIWSGQNVLGAEYDHVRDRCREIIDDLAQDRFPRPVVRVFNENQPDTRWLESRLIPAHRDSFKEQVRSFPALQQLTDKMLQLFITKLQRTEELSYNQYYNQLFGR
jgi:hypothetical protein